MKNAFLLTFSWEDSEGLEHYGYSWHGSKTELVTTVVKMDLALNNFQVKDAIKIKDFKKLKV